MDARPFFPLLLCLSIGLAGCFSPVAQPAVGLEGVSVYVQDDDLKERYGFLIDEVLDDQADVYAPLFDRGQVSFQIGKGKGPWTETLGDFQRDRTASLHIYIVYDPDMNASGLQYDPNLVIINIGAWEDPDSTNVNSAACGALGLKTREDAWLDVFRYVLMHEIGHVYGLVGKWWETERQADDGHHHSKNPGSVMYVGGSQWDDGICYGDITNLQYDADDLADLRRAAGMRPFYWESWG